MEKIKRMEHQTFSCRLYLNILMEYCITFDQRLADIDGRLSVLESKCRRTIG